MEHRYSTAGGFVEINEFIHAESPTIGTPWKIASFIYYSAIQREGTKLLPKVFLLSEPKSRGDTWSYVFWQYVDQVSRLSKSTVVSAQEE